MHENKQRKQYAHNKPRRAAVVTHFWVWKDRSKYMPHQGKAECERRVAKRDDQIARAIEYITRKYGEANG